MKQTKRWILLFFCAFFFFTVTACAPINLVETNGHRSQTANSTFSVYYIDVGQADSTLIICDDETMLIDGGNVEDSSLVYAFLEKLNISHLNYVVCTHAHEDHCGGLAGALSACSAGAVLCSVESFDSDAFQDFKSYAAKRNCSISIPEPGDQFEIGTAVAEVLGPIERYEDVNDQSIVLRITYQDTAFLFCGDATTVAENDILDTDADVSATVLKVGHHGSNTSTGYQWIRAIHPKYAVISCGKDNSYGHPHEETLSKLRDADVPIFRTDMQGTILCVSDGKNISFVPERNAAAQTNPTQEPAQADFFVGNKRSYVLHRPDCGALPDKSNQVVFQIYEQAIQAGFSPCGKCLKHT